MRIKVGGDDIWVDPNAIMMAGPAKDETGKVIIGRCGAILRGGIQIDIEQGLEDVIKLIEEERGNGSEAW